MPWKEGSAENPCLVMEGAPEEPRLLLHPIPFPPRVGFSWVLSRFVLERNWELCPTGFGDISHHWELGQVKRTLRCNVMVLSAEAQGMKVVAKYRQA